MFDQNFQQLAPTNEPMVIESFCVNCHDNGITKLLLTKIPFFKEVILSSFVCDKCGFKNTEVQSGGQIGEFGQIITLKLQNFRDISREVVKSEHASLKIPHLEFEIPPSKKGYLNTIEGFISNAIDELSQDQEARKQVVPEQAVQIEQFLDKLRALIDENTFQKFEIQVEDPSGNSYIENPHAPQIDHNLTQSLYKRTLDQLNAMGYYTQNAEEGVQTVLVEDEQKKQENQNQQQQQQQQQQKEQYNHEYLLEQAKLKNQEQEQEKQQEKEVQNDEVAHRLDFRKPLTNEAIANESQTFNVPCHGCGKEGETRMCITAIPYFKELIVMSFLCQFCGAHSTEVKTGGQISEHGKTIVLSVQSEQDIKRDVFKSDSASLKIPEVELELEVGTLGGVYTTIEGLLEKIVSNFKDNNPFVGDSAQSDIKQKLDIFFAQMEKLMSVQQQFTIIIDDPLNNSFIQNPFYPKEDPNIKVTTYERTKEQNEEFGFAYMKTENYQEENA